MANKLDAQERTRRTILKAEGKEVQELEAINKFHEGIMRRKVII